MPDQVSSVARVVPPDGGRSFWQPVPANGHITVKLAPDEVPMQCPLSLGTQTVPPGGYVREHSHDRNEEVLYFTAGTGRAVIDRVEHPVGPGTAIFVGRGRLHMFVNDGPTDLTWVWLIVPNGLEDFFAAIGRPRDPATPAPPPFARPENVLEIERSTVFGAPPADGGHRP